MVTRSALMPGDLVRFNSYHFEPDPVGLVLTVQITTVRPRPNAAVNFRYIHVLWPEHVAGRSWAGGPLQRIHEHFPDELALATTPRW